MLDDTLKKYVNESILCWVATCDNNQPAVSPKQFFTYYDDKTIIVAHINSPSTAANIEKNPNVCISFVDVFAQRGFKCLGHATIVSQDCPTYNKKVKMLEEVTNEGLEILEVISIELTETHPIIAPDYTLGNVREEMVQKALKYYGITESDLKN
ncbi:MAG: pyridoxamine 5'-phosphate oxidase family protein [Alphaproteobacteria bacterium]